MSSRSPVSLCWHFDFHSHREVRIGHKPDADGVAAALADAGVEEMITFAKGHCGYSYYPTDLKTCFRHPQMVGDPFGDLVHACKKRNIRVLAYISFGIDGEGGRHHPHWSQVGANGAEYTPDWFISVCPFTPYTDECLLPQIDEVCRRYPVDGFFFDTMSSLSTCYCSWCQRDYGAATGKRIPREASSPDMGIYGKFRHDRSLALLDRVSSFIQARIPQAAVGFNQVGSLPFPERLPAGCTRLTLDPATHGPQSRTMSLCAAYGATCPAPADVMPTIFNGGWGDWTNASEVRHEKDAIAIWARRCAVYMGDRLHPDNRLHTPSVEALKTLKRVRQAVAAEYPAAGSRLQPDVMVLHGVSMQYGADMAFFALNARERHHPLQGAADLLLDAGANFGICAEYTLADQLQGVHLLVLPQLESVLPQTEVVLKNFVEAGGQLLVVGDVPRVDGQILSWAGVEQSSAPWQNHLYLPWLAKREQDSVLVRGDCRALTAKRGTRVVSPAIAPRDMRHGIRFGWGISPPDDQPSEKPGLTRRPVGEHGGAVWCLPVPLFLDYHLMGNWQQVEYMRQLLSKLLPAPRASLVNATGEVELVLHEDEDHSWAFLVNHGGESLWGPRQWSRNWGPLPPHRVTLLLRAPDGREPRRVSVAGQEIPYTWSTKQRQVRVNVRLDTVWRIIKVQWS